MATLQQKIADIFLTRLADSPEVHAAMLAEFKELVSADKKTKADDFVRVFNLPAGREVT
jgi:hypothetical protein